MGIQNWAENIVLVNLEAEPQMGEELQTVVDMVSKSGKYNVVVDFANVDIISSSSIAKLLKLRKVLTSQDNSLVLTTISDQTKSIFTITGLESVFDFADSQFVGLASLQMAAAC